MNQPTRIFLASSSELSAERALFQLRVNNKNKQWHGDGIFLHVDVWEDFIDSLSRTRSQDEYNVAIRQADIFVLLVHTKVGRYSREELETAMRQFNATGKPRASHASISTSSSPSTLPRWGLNTRLCVT